jgi:hypothetical protein
MRPQALQQWQILQQLEAAADVPVARENLPTAKSLFS